jgi:ABC-2 type transport system permease protein
MTALRAVQGWGSVVETMIVLGIASVYLMGLGNMASVQYPRPINPERVSQGGSSSRMQGLVSLLFPLALFPIFLAYLARYALQSQIAFALMLLIAAIIGGVVYWMGLESAVNTASSRRESIMQELSKGDGPVVSE